MTPDDRDRLRGATDAAVGCSAEVAYDPSPAAPGHEKVAAWHKLLTPPAVRWLLDAAAERDALSAKLESETKRADAWMRHADTLRCPKCTHPHGPIHAPKGLAEDGYRPVWGCQCDCHADVPALRAERDALKVRLELDVKSVAAHLRLTEGWLEDSQAVADTLRAEAVRLRTAAAKFLDAAGNDLCHENRDELARAIGRTTGPRNGGLPPEDEFALKCVQYRHGLYGHPGPGSDAEAFESRIRALESALADCLPWLPAAELADRARALVGNANG